ncbi:hypothetical protein [Chromobacterium phragmitis]|uniref:Uncharacterized protein n=1 Tax=Chromobacterium phragmitis TaxID=2202141 RepID=A0A344UM74_9NEIS|nr:hypothetical protein [Chromobacterium phragmitis]AXE36372.1 hypothetical protein DK843_20000 [Chromobacterium phragmitis]
MAEVQYLLGAPIPLNQMLPNRAGVPTALPAAIVAQAGLYLILNQNNRQENRYMGVTDNFRNRFGIRQGSCFELGFAPQVLNGVYAFLGTMRYRNNGAAGWQTPAGYADANLTISLDGQDYDLEHLFIKAAQHGWPHGTITNTRKTGALANAGGFPINVTISWNGIAPNQVLVPIAAGAQLA